MEARRSPGYNFDLLGLVLSHNDGHGRVRALGSEIGTIPSHKELHLNSIRSYEDGFP